MKEWNVTFNNFQKLVMDYILIFEGAIVIILSHNFVFSNQASKSFTMMAHMWEFDECVKRTCFLKTKMVMFGHIFYNKDSILMRWKCQLHRFNFNFHGFFSLCKSFIYLFIFRFLHKEQSKESLHRYTTKNLEAYASIWTNKFVNTNLHPQLASWLKELEDAYPKELPLLKVHFGKTSFTIMRVMKNYLSTTHTDRNVLHFMICWFIKGILNFKSIFIVLPFPSFVLGLNYVCVNFYRGHNT
jgi:hypothetical protein